MVNFRPDPHIACKAIKVFFLNIYFLRVIRSKAIFCVLPTLHTYVYIFPKAKWTCPSVIGRGHFTIFPVVVALDVNFS